MPVLTDTAHSIGQIGEYVTGQTAPRTGEYYREVYLGIDASTKVPLLEVSTHMQETPTVLSQELNIPTASLELVRVPELVVSSRRNSSYGEMYATSGSDTATTTSVDSSVAASTSIPWPSVIVAFALGALIWFVYRIIRIWQDYKDQMAVLTAGDAPQYGIPAIPSITHVTEPQRAVIAERVAVKTEAVTSPSDDWRKELQNADATLQGLLDRAGVTGESMTDKLKSVSAGQFASVDLAWEAHQATKDLLATADADVSPTAVMRARSLYKQVFADHGIV